MNSQLALMKIQQIRTESLIYYHRHLQRPNKNKSKKCITTAKKLSLIDRDKLELTKMVSSYQTLTITAGQRLLQKQYINGFQTKHVN